jgi:teichuronic acid biosynthesis glycosyltransferase TuaC
MTEFELSDLYSGQLLMVTHVFPTPYVFERGAFNANLCLEFARQGLKVDVLACHGIIRRWWDSLRLKPIQAWDFSMVDITPVAFLELGRWCPLSETLRGKVALQSLRRKVEAVLGRLGSAEEVVYGIFTDAGMACLRWCQRVGVPLFVELPESAIESRLVMPGREAMRRLVQDCHGIVADSLDNRQFCIDLVPGCEEKVVYLPNAADAERFRPMDKTEVRKRLGLPGQERIVIFCGHFNERKGPLRVLEALRLAGNVKGVFLGQGPQVPKGSLVLRAAPVPNSELPLWMNAGDIFVLPSLAEGLANVIVEAMACGLPLIVSDRSFNRNFLTEQCAVFVDPESPRAMANVIKALLNDEARCKSMSARALAESHNYSMSRRVKAIRAFIQQRVAGTIYERGIAK